MKGLRTSPWIWPMDTDMNGFKETQKALTSAPQKLKIHNLGLPTNRAFQDTMRGFGTTLFAVFYKSQSPALWMTLESTWNLHLASPREQCQDLAPGTCPQGRRGRRGNKSRAWDNEYTSNAVLWKKTNRLHQFSPGLSHCHTNKS